MTSSANTGMDACTCREFGSLSYRYTHAATLIYGGALTGKGQTPAEPTAAQINISPDP